MVTMPRNRRNQSSAAGNDSIVATERQRHPTTLSHTLLQREGLTYQNKKVGWLHSSSRTNDKSTATVRATKSACWRSTAFSYWRTFRHNPQVNKSLHRFHADVYMRQAVLKGNSGSPRSRILLIT